MFLFTFKHRLDRLLYFVKKGCFCFCQVKKLAADDKLVQRALFEKKGEQVKDCKGYAVVKCGNFVSGDQ